MGSDNKANFSGWLYKIGAILLFILSAVALVAFIKAISFPNLEKQQYEKNIADSLQVEQLREDVGVLKQKVDSLLKLTKIEPKIVYKYLKPKKDSCTIEVNVHNK